MNFVRLKKITEVGLVVFFITFLLAALPALGFDNVGTGLVLLAGALLTGALLIWTNILRDTFPTYCCKHKIISTAVLLLTIGTLGAMGYRHASEEEQKEVFDHLKFSIAVPLKGELRSTRVTITNDSHTAIQYRLVCRITQLVANGGRTDIRQSSFRNHERSGMLEAGNDAQFDACLSDISIPTESLDCIDIQARLFYSLNTQPSKQIEKDHGFIAQQRENQLEWAERAAQQEVSDCQRFSKYPPGLPVDRMEVLANAINAQNDYLLKTVGINPEKKQAASLSTDVMAFGESIKDSKPKEPDLEREGFQAVPAYQKKFMEWGAVNAEEFHRRFDSRINHVSKVGRQAKIQSDVMSCLMISRSYPPTLDMTRRCGIALGQIAERLPLH